MDTLVTLILVSIIFVFAICCIFVVVVLKGKANVEKRKNALENWKNKNTPPIALSKKSPPQPPDAIINDTPDSPEEVLDPAEMKVMDKSLHPVFNKNVTRNKKGQFSKIEK